MSFTHLHVHTEYSLLDGAARIPALVARAKELGMDSLAITDHGVMYGVLEFYKTCQAVGIKPILGCEVYVAPGSRFEKSAGKEEDRYYHLVLLAENETGYHNLMKLVSRGFTEGYYYRPRVDKELLREYHEGLICLSACLAGELATVIRRGFKEEARKVANEYRDIFGAGNYFLELQDHCTGEQTDVNMEIMQISKELDIPLVCTNDSHYVYAEDAEMHDYLLCIQTGKQYDDPDRMRYEGGQYYLKSEEEMAQLFGSYAKEAMENTALIAERCNVEIVFGEQKLPRYPVPEDFQPTLNLSDSQTISDAYLTMLCKEGLKKRYQPLTDEAVERLNYELSVIRSMGYVDYFLIVWDFINYSREHDIPVGPGRGSAAGSIVAYCLGITDIDPLRFNLIFERFLNPARVTMPDIDTDFCSERRYDVIRYVIEKYGSDKAVQIVTFNTMKAKAAVGDVGRVLGYPIPFVRSISKAIPNRLPNVKEVTLSIALENSPELMQMYSEDERVKKLIDIAMKLEGLPRSSGTHPAGVVIVDRPIDEYVPLSNGANGAVVEFTMTEVEQLGLLKMDFLALRTLTMIQNVLDLVHMKDPDFDLRRISFEDPKVYELLSSGNTDGVFQLESSGMKGFMSELKPSTFEDIIAGISLYRPGPMDFIPQYIEGKYNPEKIHYDTPELEEILAPTYGCIVYQEQVMQIVMKLAGYTMGQSDEVRRAMSKKKAEVMKQERQNFVYGNPEKGVVGCIANGISEEIANKIFDRMLTFAAYAFNKSHAAGYAVVAYQTAFLKTYYPVEFMAALMTSFITNNEKVTEYLHTCRKHGVEVLPPDINVGIAPFSVLDGKIVYGLSAIKGIGTNVIDEIVEERSANGVFSDLQDFLERMTGKGRKVNKKVIEQLILAGAMDGLPGTRKEKMAGYPHIVDSVSRESKNTMEGQFNLLDFLEGDAKEAAKIKLPEIGEYEKEEKLSLEKSVLGVYVSGHPLEEYLPLIEKHATADSRDFVIQTETDSEDEAAVVVDEPEEPTLNDGETYTIGGMVSEMRTIITKKGEEMAFVTLEDYYGTVEVIVFAKTYRETRPLLTQDRKVFITGRASVEEDQIKLLASKVVPFEDLPKDVWLRFADREQFESLKDKMYGIIDEYPGNGRVKVYLTKERMQNNLPPKFSVSTNEEAMQALNDLLGEENVKIKDIG